MHEVLTDRGWRLDPIDAGHVDERGYPAGRQPSWLYPASFAGLMPHPVLDIAPEPLHCSYMLGGHDEIMNLLVVTAGNDFACARHAKTEQNLPLATLLEALPGHLDKAERNARETDARELIECRFFSRCGAAWDEHGNFR